MLTEALARTLLLMRGDLDPLVSDDELVEALASVKVVVAADIDACATHSGRCAVVATALTLARSGHDVWLDCPDVPLDGVQPPLEGTTLASALAHVGSDLLPDRAVGIGRPERCDLAVVLGAASAPISKRILRFDADDWSVTLGAAPSAGWSGGPWPIGALAVAPLAAAEAFKASMRSMSHRAASPAYFAQLHAPTETARFELAPTDTPTTATLPDFDVISGGAIANALIFVLLRLPDAKGNGRVFDEDTSAMSNLNRNAMLRRSALGIHKVEDLAKLAARTGIGIEPRSIRFEPGMHLAETVLVGVDDIPSRWAVQESDPSWTGVGATDRYSIMVSSHATGEPCSGCLHPVAPPATDAPIPTCAFVSFLSGLLLAARWLRSLSGRIPPGEQQMFLNALRPETWDLGSIPIAPTSICPVGCAASRNVSSGGSLEGRMVEARGVKVKVGV